MRKMHFLVLVSAVFFSSAASANYWGCVGTIMGPALPPSPAHTEGESLRKALVGKRYSVSHEGGLRVGTIVFVSDPNVAWSPDRVVSVGVEIEGRTVYYNGVKVADLLGAASVPVFPGGKRE